MDGRPSLEHYEESLNAVLDVIEKTYDQPLSLGRLSDIAQFSPFHFHRLFKAYTGETPNVYVRRLRLQKALGMIERRSKKNLAEIAQQCGFAQSSDFTRAFLDVYGYPPVASQSVYYLVKDSHETHFASFHISRSYRYFIRRSEED